MQQTQREQDEEIKNKNTKQSAETHYAFIYDEDQFPIQKVEKAEFVQVHAFISNHFPK